MSTRFDLNPLFHYTRPLNNKNKHTTNYIGSHTRKNTLKKMIYTSDICMIRDTE